jgi:hypothetical protein
MCADACTALRSELLETGADCTWLEAQFDHLVHTSLQGDPGLGTLYARAARKFAPAQLELSAATRAQLNDVGLLQPTWSLRQAARAWLLLRYTAFAPPTQFEAQVRDLFYKGDSDERVVVLRCLALMPDAERLALVATDAVRSHVQDVLEAIACENPYPKRHFSDLAFNQLVMKCYFSGVAAARIVGLSERRNPELKRMALDFATERRAASRVVPPDLHLVTT